MSGPWEPCLFSTAEQVWLSDNGAAVASAGSNHPLRGGKGSHCSWLRVQPSLPGDTARDAPRPVPCTVQAAPLHPTERSLGSLEACRGPSTPAQPDDQAAPKLRIFRPGAGRAACACPPLSRAARCPRRGAARCCAVSSRSLTCTRRSPRWPGSGPPRRRAAPRPPTRSQCGATSRARSTPRPAPSWCTPTPCTTSTGASRRSAAPPTGARGRARSARCVWGGTSCWWASRRGAAGMACAEDAARTPRGPKPRPLCYD